MKAEHMLAGVLLLMVFCITVLALTASDAEVVKQAIGALAEMYR